MACSVKQSLQLLCVCVGGYIYKKKKLGKSMGEMALYFENMRPGH